MESLKKIFSFFTGKIQKQSIDQIKDLKITGELYKKSIGSKLARLSSEIIMSFSQDDPSDFEYVLSLANIAPIKEITWKSLKFNVSSDMVLKFCCDSELQDCLIWEYNRDFYIFSNDTEINHSQNFKQFLENMCALIYSNTYEMKIDSVDIKKSEEFIMLLGQVKNLDQFIEDHYKDIYLMEDESEPEKNTIVEHDQQSLLNSSTSKKSISYVNFKSTYPNSKVVFEAKGSLLRFLIDEDKLETVSTSCLLQICLKDDFDYFLVVNNPLDDKSSLAIVKVNVLANIAFQTKESLVMFLIRCSFDQIDAFNFIFEDKIKLEEAKKIVTKCLYEASNNIKYDELAEEDRHFLEYAFEEEVVDSSQKDVEMEIVNEFQESSSDVNNKITSQAYLHDRTFVFRENNSIGVYKTDEDDVLTHLLNLPSVNIYKDKQLDVSAAQMYMSDTNMMLLDKVNPNLAYRYDLSKGQIVEEWEAKDIKKLNSICAEKKYSQMTDDNCILGVSSNALLTMDGRVDDKNKIVDIKRYKTNPKMEVIATSNFGGIAVGSSNGEIRLYKKVGQNAKTLLPGFGDPILSLDITSDGKWILATCPTYLVLIPTQFKGEKNGFISSMGKDKPRPKSLKLKPIDIAKYKISSVRFTPAKFNVNQNEGETNIITSTGDYIINWNFAKVIKGITDDYKIKKANQNILNSQFKFNRAQIVVTMDNKLRIQNQKYFN